MRGIPRGMDHESVTTGGSSAAPWRLPGGSSADSRCGSRLFFNENPRVELRSAARGRIKALHARITPAEAKNNRF